MGGAAITVIAGTGYKGKYRVDTQYQWAGVRFIGITAMI